jgi:sugar/nucleoside kinase (ribokinase family)
MAKFLAEVLSNDHPLFTFNIEQLEKAVGDDSVSARIVADSLESAHNVIRAIGLDPNDTTAKEIYQALNSKNEDQLLELLKDSEYVLIPFPSGVISFNIQDVIENKHHQLAFEDRILGHAQRHLRLQIVKRYAEADKIDNDLIKKLTQEIDIHREDDYDHPKFEIAKEVNGSDSPYILAIGDIFTDAFIKLGDDAAKIIKEEDGVEWLAVPFGRKPPYEKVDIVKSVGPSPNVAVSISRLGYRSGLMAWIGNDETGKEAIEHLKSERVDTSSIVTEEGKLTSYWYVLSYKADRTMLVKSEKYRYEWRDPENVPDWIYLSYLGEDSWPLHEELLKYLESHPEIKLVFQPGTFQFKWGKEKLAEIYRRSYIVLMNREEAVDVTGRDYNSVKGLAEGLHELGPEIVVITDGPNGSYAWHDGKLVTVPNYPDPAPPVERTGAGDAFSSTFVAAIAAGESFETALSWAPINSMNVVQDVGAQKGLLSRNELQHYLDQAPEYYKVTEL